MKIFGHFKIKRRLWRSKAEDVRPFLVVWVCCGLILLQTKHSDPFLLSFNAKITFQPAIPGNLSIFLQLTNWKLEKNSLKTSIKTNCLTKKTKIRQLSSQTQKSEFPYPIIRSKSKSAIQIERLHVFPTKWPQRNAPTLIPLSTSIIQLIEW